MKKFFLLFLTLATSVYSFSQQPGSMPVAKTDLMQKAMHQRHAANALLWGGAAVCLTGLSIMAKETGFIVSTGKKPSAASQIIAWTGFASMAVSIPLFIAYHRNKKKAMTVGLKSQTIPVLQDNYFTKHRVPSLTLKFNL